MKQIYITKSAYNQLNKEVRRYSQLETGGAIIGYPTKKSVFITNVTGSGPLSIHYKKSLKLDSRFCLMEYLKYRKRNYKLKYLGDWHNHPSNRLKPSQTDILTLLKKEKSHYNIPSPMLLITSSHPPVSMKAFSYHSKKIVSTIPKLVS